MGVEIEHKYLVKDNSYVSMAEKVIDIAQGYLSKEKERTVRVRVAGDRGFLTIKGETTSASRKEFEYEIPLNEAKELLELCIGCVIKKRRYFVPYEGFIWEIDEFETPRKGLIIAEIELPAEGTEYEIPDFAGENVTGQKEYYNSNLK